MTKRSILPGPLYTLSVLIVHCTLITMYVESLILPRVYTLNITIVNKVYHIKTSWVHIMNHVSLLFLVGVYSSSNACNSFTLAFMIIKSISYITINSNCPSRSGNRIPSHCCDPCLISVVHIGDGHIVKKVSSWYVCFIQYNDHSNAKPRQQK